MSRDVLIVGSTMRIPLLYRGEYSQWVERFMDYLEEQTDGEAMINSIKNGDQPLPRVTQVTIAGTSSTQQSPLKDKSIWKAAVLYEYETFKAIEGEFLLDTYIRYLKVINDLKKCGYSKDNCELNFKFLNNLQPEWKQDVNDAMGLKKKTDVVNSDPLALIAEKTKEGHFVKDCQKVKVKDYEYYKIKMLLAKKDKDEQVILAEDQAWMESSNDLDQEINANMVFMAQIEKVLLDSETSSSSADNKISEVSYYLFECESESEYETSDYYDDTTTYGLFVNDNDDQEISYDCEIFPENLIESQINHNESAIDHNDFEGIDKDLKNTILEKDFKISELEECVRNKDLEIEKCLERLNVCENKLHKMGQTNQIVHMIMPSEDTLYNGRKGIGFENPIYFEKAKDLRHILYDEKVIGLGYTSMFLTHSDEALEIEKFKRARENKIEFAYDYGNLNQTSSLKPYVPTVILEKIIIDLEDEVIVQIYLWIFDSGCSKHMRGNRALLTNFVEKFLGTVHFGNNDFAVIAGYGDVGLEVAFRKSTCFVRNEDGVDLLTGDRSSNLYTIALNEVASNSLTCLLAKASSSQSWLWH
uniref:Retrovirus-related Pol polyprotein from transposon TNT 1-94-like beta-barrel domain-containing protein n=1 Tax=Tanacetum cinerariifolium TaxID=118510 RepID=A0A699HKL0_TANCI|nr:hypothetical protein [Tanacetum cinerariifolium]